MLFWTDIVIPIIVVALSIGLIVFALNLILRAVHLDITIIRILAFFIIWYFVGPVIYNFLLNHLITNEQEGIKILYMPIQFIYQEISKLV